MDLDSTRHSSTSVEDKLIVAGMGNIGDDNSESILNTTPHLRPEGYMCHVAHKKDKWIHNVLSLES